MQSPNHQIKITVNISAYTVNHKIPVVDLIQHINNTQDALNITFVNDEQ